jgi:hypothetical protein
VYCCFKKTLSVPRSVEGPSELMDVPSEPMEAPSQLMKVSPERMEVRSEPIEVPWAAEVPRLVRIPH